MEIAAVSTTAGDSDATVSALCWYGSWHDTAKERIEREERVKEKAKVKEWRKGERNASVRKQRERKRRLVE